MSAGLEPAAAEELSRLGLSVIDQGRGVVRFGGSAEDGARAVLGLRSAPRVALELGERLPARSAEALRAALARIPWEEHLPRGTSWAARAIGHNEALRDTRFAARVVKDAVADRFGAFGRTPPPVDPGAPAILVELRIGRETARIGFDLAGHSLHERGTGRRGEAPLREDVAAGLALLAGVSPDRPLLDPFCGTGTLLAEAAAIVRRRPPRRDPRTLALRHLPAFAGVDLAKIAAELASRAVRGPIAPILGYDRDGGALAEARTVIARLGLDDDVRLARAAVPDLPLPSSLAPGLLLSNPPWGVRFAE